MSRFLSSFTTAAVVFTGLLMTGTALAGDALKGEKVFKKCKACHAVGEGAKHRIGPQLNGLFGRTAGSADGYKYSNAMKAAGAEGLVWDEETIADFLANPRKMMKGTKMAFAGLRKPNEVEDLIAWLKQETANDGKAAAKEEPAAKTSIVKVAPEKTGPQADKAPGADAEPHGVFNLGRQATDEEIAAWDIDIRPDGLGLPDGRGTAVRGEEIFTEQCAACHGVFGEGAGRWPVLAGGQGTLKDERPVKTIGSYWPYLSTVYDYVRRTMPFGNARSLSDDDVYAVTAYLLYLNDIVTDENFELSKDNFDDIKMPNAPNFKPDDRLLEPGYAEKGDPCMSDCASGPAKVSMRAAVLDVTPDGNGEEEVGGGLVD